jgi:hypothetical protein
METEEKKGLTQEELREFGKQISGFLGLMEEMKGTIKKLDDPEIKYFLKGYGDLEEICQGMQAFILKQLAKELAKDPPATKPE